MSGKQKIYHEMFRRTLPHLRNMSSLSWWRRWRDQSSVFESELIHNLFVSMFEPEFVNHDIYFLNAQAQWYVSECSETKSPLYRGQVALIAELFALVPEQLRPNLQWAGPKCDQPVSQIRSHA